MTKEQFVNLAEALGLVTEGNFIHDTDRNTTYKRLASPTLESHTTIGPVHSVGNWNTPKEVKETIHADQLSDMLSAATSVYFGVDRDLHYVDHEDQTRSGIADTAYLAQRAMNNLLQKMIDL